MKRLFIISVFSFGLLSPAVLHAQSTPPIPPRKELTLETLQKNLKQGEAQKKKLESQIQEIEKDMKATQDRLVKVGRAVQGNERSLQKFEGRIVELEKEQETLQEKLNEDHQSIGRLILALERIRRLPPEALIAKPDAPIKTAQTAMLMREIIPAIHKQAEALKTNLGRLDAVTSDLVAQRDEVLKTSQTLKKEQEELASLLEKRKAFYASTHDDLKAQQESIKRIAAQASSLKDLMARIDEQQRVAAASAAASAREAGRSAPRKPVAVPDQGGAQMPLSGVIRLSYNQNDIYGAPSKGIEIEGRGGALIVAPMGGVVRFAGHFKNYGNMVILEHKGGYHSLIAGLEKIDTVVGQSVASGEPLGILHYATNERNPTLYYELRHKGEAINPATKLADLG